MTNIVKSIDYSFHIIPDDAPFVKLDATSAFKKLKRNDQLYAYYLSKASWEGSKICLFQTSFESPAIFLIFQQLFGQKIDLLKKDVLEKSKVKENEFHSFLIYAASFYANMGNYKSFGDTKIIPGCSKESFITIVKAGKAYSTNKKYLDNLLSQVIDLIYSCTANNKQLGFRPTAYNSYYSENMSKEEAELVQKYMDENKLPAWNTRIFKYETTDKTSNVNRKKFQIRFASHLKQKEAKTEKYQDVEISIMKGEYCPIMKRVADSLEKALEFANEEQHKMIKCYIDSFRTGSIEAHKAGSRHWIKDKSPIVESYIGFIETYRDPLGARAEWEGFVAVVNIEQSKKFNNLVTGAEKLLKKLPWPKEFEKDTFQRPDFTSLDVISFGSSSLPAGINIPNYDEIRQEEGFKNVSLGNVLSASLRKNNVTFLSKQDEDYFKKYAAKAFEVQVGLHELLGHGSGKLLLQRKNGSLNFNSNTMKIPYDKMIALASSNDESKKLPITYYKDGETWDAKFPIIGSSYEECRAECVGIYLCLEKEVLNVFGYTNQQELDDIMYTNWLLMVRAGLVSLEFYNKDSKAWGQAHMQARFAILQVLLEAGNNLVVIKTTENDTNLLITLNREKIVTVGKPSIGKFLTSLQIYKSLGNFAKGKELYDKYTKVNDLFLSYREIVIKKKKPRELFVQPELILDNIEDLENTAIKIKEFEASAKGMIESFQQRFPSIDNEMLSFWKETKPMMKHV